ncbi:YD repeat-containing protein [Chryseobacterium taeanense]|uniref:YD repeat-containing protein n=1 Tax=Chryseobacterium taeanense TaxID=311334 RepID=A0A1G8FS17_9FLAO|nr:RHS repeat protein [Chryseobacterium taeanense]SDH84924.1 YD repeat-containing protein [Chryseobacterium taeanense]
MKKVIVSSLLLTAFVASINISGQDKVGLSKYDYVTNGDANMFQGIPNISFPLFNVGVPTTGVNIIISLSYTSESASAFSLISDIGKGWNLSNIGSIVRSKTRFENDYYTVGSEEAFSDVYYYSYPGGSGKFYIGMDTVHHDLLGVHVSPSNDKIFIIKDDTKPGKVKSFTIVDTKGNHYVFDKININKIYIGDDPLGSSAVQIAQHTKFINSAFYLSKILNVKNEVVASVEYTTTTQNITQPNGVLQNQKIGKIHVNGIGSIEYIYAGNPNPINLNNSGNNDWYTLNKLILKNTQNQIIDQYAFTRTGNLKELINQDKYNITIQKFSFEYKNEDISQNNMYNDGYGYPCHFEPCNIDEGELRTPFHTDRNSVSNGALQRIILPSGGVTEYEFESHSVPSNPYATCVGANCYYDNYDFDKIYTLNFDTNISSQYTVNLPTGYQSDLFVKYNYTLHPAPPGNPGSSNEIKYTINNQSGNPFLNPLNNEQECTNGIKRFVAQGTINIKFTGLKKGYGTVEIYATKQQKRDKNDYGYGLRLKSMKNFNPGSTTPVSYTQYNYDSFTDSLLSSGENLDYSEKILYTDYSPRPNEPIGYSNIKVTNMIDGSYSKYYYKPSTDIVSIGNSTFPFLDDRNMSNYLISSGLLQRKEDYSSNNQLLQKSEISYVFKEVPLPNLSYNGNPVKKMNISKQVTKTETYINGTSKKLVTSSESNFDDTYGHMTFSKETTADGTVFEKTLLYPSDKENQKLLTANMVDVLLESTTKRNGKLVGKVETKFDDVSHIYPTSVISYGMQTQTPVTATTLDIYDSKGNLLQSTSKNGIPTTTIWGYYQTKPIAVISGASYAQVSSLASVNGAIAASNADHDNPAMETQLLTALENLRKDPALQNYTITVTTYDPMIGVTNSISANGIRTVNVYDTANRLIKITDAAGKTLQEYKYNYKN